MFSPLAELFVSQTKVLRSKIMVTILLQVREYKEIQMESSKKSNCENGY